MDPDRVVIATTTLYGSLEEVRAKLALSTIEKAIENGFQIIVVDSSNDEIRHSFSMRGAKVLKGTSSGMGINRRYAIREAKQLAGENGVIVWTEPEKAPLIPLLPDIITHLESADMVIPKRKSLKSYPIVQQHSEWLGNRDFLTITGLDLDVFFGPRIFRADASSFFLSYKGEYGDEWDSIFIPVLRAIKAGELVIGVEVNYTHPKEQTREEERLEKQFSAKRIRQLVSLIHALRKESQILGLNLS